MPKIRSRTAHGDDQEDIYFDNGREAKLPGLDPFFGRWIKHLRNSAAADSTVSNYARSLKICLLFLTELAGGTMSVDAFSRLRPDDIKRMQQEMLGQGYKPRTIEGNMAALHGFARFLHTHCGIRCDGVIVSRLLTYGRSERHVPANEDRDNLLEAARRHDVDSSWKEFRTRALTMLVSRHGLKMGEVLGLDFGDVDLIRCSALIRKGSQSRIVPLSSSTAQAITEYLTVCPFNVSDGWPLFVGQRAERLTHITAERSIVALRNQLGLHEQTDSNSLRNARMLELHASGYNDIAIMEELGLSSRKRLATVLANTPSHYAATEFTHPVHNKIAPMPTAQNICRIGQPQVVTAQQRGRHVNPPDRQGRGKRIASIHDADAATYIDHVFNTKQLGTASRYSYVVRQFADEFLASLQKQVRTANSEDISAFFQARNATRGEAAVDYAALKDFYIFLFDRGAVANIPVLDVKPARLREERLRDAASTAHVRAWISKLWDYTALHPNDVNIVRLQAFVSLLALQGLKSNEALSLRRSAFTGNLLQVKDRTLTTTRHTRAALEMLVGLSGPVVDLIFPGRYLSQAMNRHTMWVWMKKIQQKLDLPKVTPEQFTQAFRRNLFAILRDAVEVSKAVGLRNSDVFAARQRKEERFAMQNGKIR
jgi:integrase/recombinase XerC